MILIDCQLRIGYNFNIVDTSSSISVCFFSKYLIEILTRIVIIKYRSTHLSLSAKKGEKMAQQIEGLF